MYLNNTYYFYISFLERYYLKTSKGIIIFTKEMIELLGENLNILVKGVNDLATLNPKLIEEWDYENNDKTPDCYTLNSNQEVYWVCKKCGNHWKSYINQRSVCPNCNP